LRVRQDASQWWGGVGGGGMIEGISWHEEGHSWHARPLISSALHLQKMREALQRHGAMLVAALCGRGR